MGKNILTFGVIGLTAAFYLGSPTQVTAQEEHFDHSDPKKAIIESTIHNGRPAYKNGYGEVLRSSSVYDMPLEEQIELGYTQRVTAEDGSEFKSNGAESGSAFNLTFLDVVNNTNKGFDDPELGEARRNILSKAFAYYAGIINNQGIADIEIQTSTHQNFGAFASSASYYFSSAGFNDGLVAKHLISGFDPAGGVADGYIQFNFAYNYSYSLNSAPPSNQYDFYTVCLHEILHVLGFSSFCNANGGTQAPSPNVFTSFDKYLMIQDGQPFYIVSGSGAETTVAAANPNYVTNNQMLFLSGEGILSPVHSPSSFTGSSIDHFDNNRSNGGDYLMHPSLSRGVRIGSLHHDEAYVLAQLGFSINLSLATSIEQENMLDVSAKIFPNPAIGNGGVSINLEGLQGNKEILVVVYDMMGKKAYSKVLVTEGDGVFTAIDPYHNLAPGMYIVIGSAKDELFNQKLMILGNANDAAQPFNNR